MTFIFIFTNKSFKVNGLWERRKEREREKVGGRKIKRKEGKKINGIVIEPKYISTK